MTSFRCVPDAWHPPALASHGTSPAGLGNAWNQPLQRVFTEANTAHAESSHIGARATTEFAAIVCSHLILWWSLGLDDQRLLSQCVLLLRLRLVSGALATGYAQERGAGPSGTLLA